jgi:hypothetical protein
MSDWKPVDTYFEFHETGCPSYELFFNKSGAIEIERDKAAELIELLPTEYRMCERVKPEPITQSALQAEGWGKRSDALVYEKQIDATELLCFFWYDEEGNEQFEIVYAAVEYPGIRTMQDLRDLVRFLGGDP